MTFFKVVQIEKMKSAQSQVVYTNSKDSIELFDFGMATLNELKKDSFELIAIMFVNDTSSDKRPILKNLASVSRVENSIAVFRGEGFGKENDGAELEMVFGK